MFWYLLATILIISLYFQKKLEVSIKIIFLFYIKVIIFIIFILYSYFFSNIIKVILDSACICWNLVDPTLSWVYVMIPTSPATSASNYMSYYTFIIIPEHLNVLFILISLWTFLKYLYCFYLYSITIYHLSNNVIHHCSDLKNINKKIFTL